MQQYYNAQPTGLFPHDGSSLSSQIKPRMPKGVWQAIMEVENQFNDGILLSLNEICAAV